MRSRAQERRHAHAGRPSDLPSHWIVLERGILYRYLPTCVTRPRSAKTTTHRSFPGDHTCCSRRRHTDLRLYLALNKSSAITSAFNPPAAALVHTRTLPTCSQDQTRSRSLPMLFARRTRNRRSFLDEILEARLIEPASAHSIWPLIQEPHRHPMG